MPKPAPLLGFTVIHGWSALTFHSSVPPPAFDKVICLDAESPRCMVPRARETESGEVANDGGDGGGCWK